MCAKYSDQYEKSLQCGGYNFVHYTHDKRFYENSDAMLIARACLSCRLGKQLFNYNNLHTSQFCNILLGFLA